MSCEAMSLAGPRAIPLERFFMHLDPADRPAAIMGIVFALWFMGLLYLLVNALWLAIAPAVVVGIVILLVARSVSRRGAGPS